MSRDRLRFLFACISLLLLGVLTVVHAEVRRRGIIDGSSSLLILMVGVPAAVLVLAQAALIYLSRSSAPISETFARKLLSGTTEYDALDVRLKALERQFRTALEKQTAASLQLTDDERKSLLANLQSTLETTFGDSLLKEFDEKYSKQAVERLKHEELQTSYVVMRARLCSEVEDLGRRGNLNLVLGGATTLVGLGILAVFVLSPPPETDTARLAAYYVPRVSMVAFIQVFGFFFLRLYRNSLEGIKYFQNELTNIETRFLALTGAMAIQAEKTVASILATLAKTERNFVLSKGQTTVEIERAKLDSNGIHDAMSLVNGLTHKTRTAPKSRFAGRWRSRCGEFNHLWGTIRAWNRLSPRLILRWPTYTPPWPTTSTIAKRSTRSLRTMTRGFRSLHDRA